MSVMDNKENNNIAHSSEANKVDDWVFQQKIEMLYINQTQSWILSILASALIAHLSIGSSNEALGLVWWAAFVVVTLVRTLNTRLYFRCDKDNKLKAYQHWYMRFAFSTLLAGIFWGIGAYIVGSAIEQLEKVYILIVLIGVTGAAIPSLGVMQKVMLLFQAPTLVPYIIYLALLLGERGTILFFMVGLYMLGAVVAVRQIDKNLSKSLALQYGNFQMMTSLSESNQELQSANEKLETLTLEDTLTGLYNRRYFEQQLKSEWKRDSREKNILTLMVIDIDYFKLYNDTYGHAEGDECLKTLAKVLQNSIQRPADIIARIGGEEFVALLPGVNVDGALLLAQSMQDQLQGANLIHATSPLGENVTVSIGMASVIPSEQETALGLFKAADKALYKAKAKGRNQIVVGAMETLAT